MNKNNNSNASSREDPNRNSRERGPSEEPPVKKRRNEFKPQLDRNKFSVRSLISGDIETILSAIDCEVFISVCDEFGRNVMHYASSLNWFNVVQAVVSKPHFRYLMDSLTMKKQSPLIIAAKMSHKNIVEFLLKSGANFEIADNCGMTLLHYASAKGWLDIVKEVIQKGIGIDALTSKHETALIIAAKHSNEEVVSFLIAKKAKSNVCNKKGWNILHFAVKNKSLKIIQAAANATNIEAKTKQSNTALLLAVRAAVRFAIRSKDISEHKDILKALINLGSDVNCCDKDGWNLLHYASFYGWFDVVASAVNKNADIDSAITETSETPILLAARNSHKDIVKFFIYLGVKFNCTDNFGRNMLTYSSINGWIDIAQYAVERKGLNPNAETADHKTALQLASRHNKKDVASFLIDVGANIQFIDLNGWSFLHHAAANEWCDLAQRVLNQVDINAKTKKSNTALEIAQEHSREQFMVFLIDAGADIHCNGERKTVLHHAAKSGQLEVVKSAVKNGACIDSLAEYNATALLLAARFSRPDMVYLLIDLGANVNLFDYYGNNVLHYAATREKIVLPSAATDEKTVLPSAATDEETVLQPGWLDVAQFAIKKGARINSLSAHNETALLRAARHSYLDMVFLLIELGTDTTLFDRHGKTILHHAATHGWLEVAQSAIKKGAHICVESVCVKNDSALHLAARHSYPDIVHLLIEVGAKVNLFDFYGKTVLHYAAERGWLTVIQSVIKNGGDVNVMNATYDTPLHVACKFGKIDVLKNLLEAGADFNIKGPGSCVTPFSYACKNNDTIDKQGNVEAVKLFIEHGAFPGIDDCVYFTETSELKEGILCNEKICAQALVNKYNNQDLSRLYSLPFSDRFPLIENVKIGKGQMALKEIEGHVKNKINTKGYCDFAELYYERPCLLGVLSLSSLLLTYRNLIL